MSKVEQLITEHIDIWTSAILAKSTAGRGSNKKYELYGIKKLRELILELAVRGKLVPQDPADEPASELLKKIAAEKSQLIKEGKVKKSKPVPEISDEEKPFDIPSNWDWTQLCAIAEINPRNDVDDNTDVSFVPMTLVSTSYKGEHETEIKTWGEIKKGYTHFADGDIAIAKITPCFENSKAAIFSNLKNGVGAGTTELHVARPIGNNIELRFVLLYLKSPRFLAVGEFKMTGSAGQKRVPKSYFEGNPLPVPPLLEQQRIVAKVDELMLLCDQLEQQTETSIDAHATLVEVLLATLTDSADANELAQNWARVSEHFATLFTTEQSIEALKQTLLQLAVMGKLVPQDPDDEPAAVLLEKIAAEKAQLIKDKKIKKEKPLPPIGDDEKPFELPVGWEWVRLANVSTVGTGGTPSRAVSGYWESKDISWVTSGETSESFIFATKEKVSNLAVQETNVSVYPPGTLIIAMYGQGKTRGQVSELMIDAGTNQACAAIRLIQSDVKHRSYIKLFFLKSYDEIRSHAAGGAQPNLNVGKISSTVIPLPPLTEQHRIVTKVDELMGICEQLKTDLQQSQKTQVQLTDALVDQALV